MIITIDTSRPLDLAAAFMLRELIEQSHPSFPVGNRSWPTEEKTSDEQEEAPEEEKPAPKKRVTKKSSAPTDVKDAAVQLATRLASEQRKDVIRAALETVGATRVSTLDEEQAAAFIAAVEAAE